MLNWNKKKTKLVFVSHVFVFISIVPRIQPRGNFDNREGSHGKAGLDVEGVGIGGCGPQHGLKTTKCSDHGPIVGAEGRSGVGNVSWQSLG